MSVLATLGSFFQNKLSRTLATADIRLTFSCSRIIFPRCSRLAFVDLTTEVKSHSACFGYSSRTLRISLPSILYVSWLGWPTRDTTCGKAIYHWKHYQFNPLTPTDHTYLVCWHFANGLHCVVIAFLNAVSTVFVCIIAFPKVQPESEQSGNSLIDVF